jgi:menaquinone-specific isochorismate synthase
MGGLTREGTLLQVPCKLMSWDAGSHPGEAGWLHEMGHAFDEREWIRRCQLARAGLAQGCQKVVLARSTRFAVSPQQPSADLAAGLCARLRQPNLSSLWIEQTDCCHWVAATPEMLFERDGDRLRTEALAGTVRAAPDPELRSSLLSCPLRRQEVLTTAEGICRQLERCGAAQIRCGPVETRLYRHWAHLYIPIEARLQGQSDGDLLRCLHPSPAVCGWPRVSSGSLRQTIEGPTEGWYAGAVGLSTPAWARFAVVLRCAHLAGHDLTAWCGVGLVPGFDPEREWQELEVKLATWRSLQRPASLSGSASCPSSG